MALLDNGSRPRVPTLSFGTSKSHLESVGTNPYTFSRDALPSINHLDIDRAKHDKSDKSRFSIMSGLNISTTLESPAPVYPGPPPPYSCATSTTGPVHISSGYISPAESTTRRSLREEKESPLGPKSLPSIHEALGESTMMPAPLSIPQSHTSSGMPSAGHMSQSFPDAPQGPLNPFSLLPNPKQNAQDANHAFKQPISSTHVEHCLPKTVPPVPKQETTPRLQQAYQYPASPRQSLSASHRNSTSSVAGNVNRSEILLQSPYQTEQVHQRRSFPEHQSLPAPDPSPNPGVFRFEAGNKFEDPRNPFNRNNPPAPYGDTVKRHLDIYDAEIAFNEVNDASTRTLDFSRFWSQRFHQGNRSSYFTEEVPSIHEVEDMMRQSQRVIENLGRIRDIVVMQQTALSEERARAAASNRTNDDYHVLTDDYKSGGFAGGDAKKRRGKAAPPGRCHSCNRAETPEWRRGPDGARTLCNACGLHYAKLTRKMGAGKASSLTGSSLRPKNLDAR